MVRRMGLLGVVLACAAWMGCGGGTVPVNEEGIGDLHVEHGPLAVVHTYGSTECPTPVSTFYLRNDGTTPITVTIDESSPVIDVHLVDVDTGARRPYEPFVLAPGESAEAAVSFNCGAPEDARTTLTITATPDEGTPASRDFQIDVDVVGAP